MFTQQDREFLGDVVGGSIVVAAEGIVVEGYAVELGDEEERPVRAGFCLGDALCIVDGEEDVGCF